ncbi:MAG: TetR/AcrR family transcriptional regulator [Ilumatobacteraceae bacterium]|nr:TetR/AcrR family transcriptional regulator [Ilumatobacteraceae bacterium]
MSAAARRTAILDVALDILRADGEQAISIGSVAERAEVTRALVYKHFDNRDDLAIALYRREAQRLDDHLIELVRGADGGFESKLRALVRGLLDATDVWGRVFNPLSGTPAGPIGRRERRERQDRTIGFFADLAARDYGLPAERAHLAIRVLWGGLDPLMWQVRPTSDTAERDALGDLYVQLVVDAVRGIDT